jgi:release factor glutamine methyltransferase
MTMTATLDPRPSIATARRALAQSFRRHGLATPELDARLLVAHALGLDHAALAAQAARALTTSEADAIAALAARRRAREPVARITGVKEFWGLNFKLNSATLVPRPETETVVTDKSRTALGCARDNAVALGLAERASFVACDYGSALQGPFDIVVSNPPYVARDDIATLAPEVRVFDPRLALDGGPDGLDAYRAIAAAARHLLSPQSVLVLELGIGQLGAVEGLLAAAGLVAIGGPRHDLLGIARALAVKLLP